MIFNFFSKTSLYFYKNKKKKSIIAAALVLGLFPSFHSTATVFNKQLSTQEQLNLLNAHNDALLDYNQSTTLKLIKEQANVLPIKSVVKNNLSSLKSIIEDNKKGKLTYRQRLIAEHISNKYAKLDIKTAHEIVKQAYIKAEKHNIDPEILIAIAGVESNYNPKIVNNIGASGLTQVVKRYHQDKIRKINAKGGNILTIADNLDVGAEIYSILYKKYGNDVMALQAYNGSQKDKTRRYSKKVMKELKGIQLSYLN